MPTFRRVLIVLPRHAHLLDVAGPAQVFVSASELGGSYLVSCVADSATVPTHQGMSLTADVTWPALGPGDVVVVPGWKTQATRQPLSDELLARVRRHWDDGGQVASICAGSLILAHLGILDGQPATTHHDLVGELSRRRAVQVKEDVLYTCADRLHTSAGIASGIDLSLHLVAHDLGPAFAAKVARMLVVPAWRPGAASQQSTLLVHRDHMDDLAHRAQDILDTADADPLPLSRLADRLGVSDRTLSRHFTAAVGMTPHAYQTALRRERADALVTQGWSRDAAARALGYAGARSLRSRSGAHPAHGTGP